VVISTAVFHLKPTFATCSCTNTAVKLSTNLNVGNDSDAPSSAPAGGGTMVQLLPASCAPGYVTIGYQLGSTILSEPAEDFGYKVGR